ncbi:DUF747-domain-containing protein [Salix suchowensis]|nr:DUF747-domain-containing protein [Salix suchowensis]
MASETIVDWLKHAFITKFNHIRPSVYERYTDVLCRDLASASAVSRLGVRKVSQFFYLFPPHSNVELAFIRRPIAASCATPWVRSLPLAVLAILIGTQSVTFSSPYKWIPTLNGPRPFYPTLIGHITSSGSAGCSVLALRRAGMDAREAEDTANDFGRPPIGEGKEEQAYNRELKGLLNNKRDDATPIAEIGEGVRNQNGDGGGKGKGRVKLEDLTRFTMVKRIW